MDYLKKLDEIGAVYLNRHFVYVSGKHGSGYINPDRIFPHVELLAELTGKMVEPFLELGVETVATPATGGIAIAMSAARSFLDRGRSVAAVWADKSDGQFVFERSGFIEHLDGKRVLVVEDLLNTGGSVEKVCRAAESAGARLVGVSVICNRGGMTAEKLGVPKLNSLFEVSFSATDPDRCDLCRSKTPIVENIGHGATFKAKNPNHPGGYVRL